LEGSPFIVRAQSSSLYKEVQTGTEAGLTLPNKTQPKLERRRESMSSDFFFIRQRYIRPFRISKNFPEILFSYMGYELKEGVMFWEIKKPSF